MDVTFGYVRCTICDDYVYDADFERLSKKTRYKNGHLMGLQYTQYSLWEPKRSDVELLKKNQRILSISSNSWIGESDFS